MLYGTAPVSPEGGDAVVVGSGPNGLSAAIVLAHAGYRVTVIEAGDGIGGGARSAELTLPGFSHDICSAFHPFALSSPFFASLPLEEHGLEWIQPDLPMAHPLDDGTAVALERSVDATARALGVDEDAYRRMFAPLVERWEDLAAGVLGPLLRPPRHPFLMARFGLMALRSATGLGRARFADERARALFAGIAAHAIAPLEGHLTAAFGLILGAAGHAVGWPVPRGGSQAIADALASYLRSLGGTVKLNWRVETLDELPDAELVLFDTSPGQLLRICGDRLPARYQRRLTRFAHGPGAFKIDYALSEAVPWTAEACARAGTVHLGGTLDEIAAAEAAVGRGEHAERPYMLVGQQSRFDASRAPDGQHTLWAYCHVPAGSSVDMTELMEAQLERYAPGFRDLVLARHVMTPADLETYNENYVRGDIAGGSSEGLQMLFRPTFSVNPYATPLPGVFLASASTPPGPGVHGMCGYYAARAALRSRHRAAKRLWSWAQT